MKRHCLCVGLIAALCWASACKREGTPAESAAPPSATKPTPSEPLPDLNTLTWGTLSEGLQLSVAKIDDRGTVFCILRNGTEHPIRYNAWQLQEGMRLQTRLEGEWVELPSTIPLDVIYPPSGIGPTPLDIRTLGPGEVLQLDGQPMFIQSLTMWKWPEKLLKDGPILIQVHSRMPTPDSISGTSTKWQWLSVDSQPVELNPERLREMLQKRQALEETRKKG